MRPRVILTYGGDREKLAPYLAAVSNVGLEPVPVSPESDWEAEEFDGLVLTGGADVDPARYGQSRWPETGAPDPTRDRMEAALLKRALNSDLPVLAICRGMQLFNVEHGGSLIQHLPAAVLHRCPGQHDVHPVRVLPDTKLASILGAAEYSVNSRHHQAAEKVGEGLVVSARAPDGVIEALERPDKLFAVAVQWHPEDRVAQVESDKRLFEAFADAVRKRAAQRQGTRPSVTGMPESSPEVWP